MHAGCSCHAQRGGPTMLFKGDQDLHVLSPHRHKQCVIALEAPCHHGGGYSVITTVVTWGF